MSADKTYSSSGIFSVLLALSISQQIWNLPVASHQSCVKGRVCTYRQNRSKQFFCTTSHTLPVHGLGWWELKQKFQTVFMLFLPPAFGLLLVLFCTEGLPPFCAGIIHSLLYLIFDITPVPSIIMPHTLLADSSPLKMF